METGPLADRPAVITGASSGIGEATAIALAGAGAPVALGARRVDRLERLKEKIEGDGGTAVALEVDVSDEAAARRFIERAHDELGGLGALEGAHTEHLRRMLDVNLAGLLWCTHAALPIMREGGGGDIVNISSTAGRTASAGAAVYNMTKWGVTGFSEALRQEALHSNIRVTCIEPGFVDTELQGHNEDPVVQQGTEKMREKIGKVLEPGDIAQAILTAVSQPPWVCLNEVLVRPTGQAR